MAQLKYYDKHNQVGFLCKPVEREGFAEMTATATTIADGTLELRATIDSNAYTITEASIRSKLQLEDVSGISTLPNTNIFEGMRNMGYPTDDTFTFWKSHFTPSWRYLIHDLLHCLSSKSGGWNQFGSNLATALVCLSTGRAFNFSKLILDGMVSNLKSKHKFLMYPRFLQMVLDIETENKNPYLAVTLTKKIFRNMKRGFKGVPRPLLPAMLPTTDSAGKEAQLPLSASQPQPTSQPPLTTQPPATQPTPKPTPTGHPNVEDLIQLVPQLISRIDGLEKELRDTKQTYGTALVTLVKRVKTLEVALKRKSRKMVVSDSEGEESESQGRNVEREDDPLISLAKEFMTPTKIKDSGEIQEKDISPTTLEVAKTLSKVALQMSVDKGKRYMRRKELKAKSLDTGLILEEEVNPGFKDINSGDGEVNTGSTTVKSGTDPVNTDSVRVSIPSPTRTQREGKYPMVTEEASKKTKEQILQEEASLAEALRLQRLEDEEQAEKEKQIHIDALIAQRVSEELELSEQQKKRKA
ncbi:hypothetical protein Tco_0158101 [Tanacetum coccineum]